ncbi:MAG: SDR family NAD(P)-dependent oxidoreductase, partial [Candidatus Acidiferrales bacterium]
MPLANRVALVTGASRGLGKGIALALAAEGMRIALCYRTKQTAAKKVARQIQALGAEVLVQQADVTVPAQVEKLVKGTVKHFGRIDVLINNVG